MGRYVLLLGVLTVSFTGCERFEKPTLEQCTQAVTSLVSHQMQMGLDEAFPTEGDDSVADMASGLLKGMGKELLTKVVVNDQMVAWCEVNMNLQEANCLRTAQSTKTALGCGFRVNEDGEITRQ